MDNANKKLTDQIVEKTRRLATKTDAPNKDTLFHCADALEKLGIYRSNCLSRRPGVFPATAECEELYTRFSESESKCIQSLELKRPPVSSK